MANAQDNRWVERIVMPTYEYKGVAYFLTIHYFDSLYIQKQAPISVLRDGKVQVSAFRIKDIGVDKDFALLVQDQYQVYSSRKNTEQEEDLLRSYAQDFQKRKQNEKDEAEQLRKHIADNPWPYKTVFGGKTYTRTNFKDSDQGIGSDWLGDKIGETTQQLKADTAYPKNYEWQEGQSLHSANSRINNIKGIDTAYYIYVDGYIYANDNQRDDEIEHKLRKHSQNNFREVSLARARYSYEYRLKREGAFSPNTIQKMVNLKHPEVDNPIADNSLLQIRALYLAINHYPPIVENGAVSGYFEIDLKTTTDKHKEFSVQNYGLPMAKVHDLKVKDNTSFFFRAVQNTRSYRLFSELIDNEIPNRAKPTQQQKPNSNNVLIRLANNSYRTIDYQDLPKTTQKAIELFIWESLEM